MIGLPATSISALRIVRTCPEHRCRILRTEKFWRRYRAGELKLHISETVRKSPKPDHNGKLRFYNRETFLQDPTYPKGHERFIVLRAHSYRTQTKEIAGSGLNDPKEMIVGDRNYRQFEDPKHPHCDLCEREGDMIHNEERFYGSTYRPSARPTSFWRKLVGVIRMKTFRLYDQWDQRGL